MKTKQQDRLKKFYRALIKNIEFNCKKEEAPEIGNIISVKDKDLMVELKFKIISCVSFGLFRDITVKGKRI